MQLNILKGAITVSVIVLFTENFDADRSGRAITAAEAEQRQKNDFITVIYSVQLHHQQIIIYLLVYTNFW